MRAGREPARHAARPAFRGRRRAAREAGRVLRGQRRGDAARAAARVRARKRDAAHRAGGAAHRSDRRARRASRRRSTASRQAAERGLEDALAARERTAADEAQRAGGAARARSRRRRCRPAVRRRVAADRADGAGRACRRDAARQRGAGARPDRRAPRAARDGARNVAAPDDRSRGRRAGAARSGDRGSRRASSNCRRSCRRPCSRCRSGSASRRTRGSETSKRLADLEARADALSALQAKIGHGKDVDGWLDARGLTHARRLWQALDIEPGWEDALEAVLRERLNALELSHLDAGARVGRRRHASAGTHRGLRRSDRRRRPRPQVMTRCSRRCGSQRPAIARVLADGLHGVRCRRDLAAALGDRATLASGETFVTPEGHRVTRAKRAVVRARQRTARRPGAPARAGRARRRSSHTAREGDDAARIVLDTVERDLQDRQEAWHRESLALASQQRRCHDLELELVQLRQAAEAAKRRRAQIAQESAELASQHAQGSDAARVASPRRSPTCNRGCTTSSRSATRRGTSRNEAEVALARGRERVRIAERAAQEAGFAERSCRDRLAEIARRREGLAAQVDAAAGIARAADERAGSRSTGRRSRKRCSGNSPRAARPSRRSPMRATRRKR